MSRTAASWGRSVSGLRLLTVLCLSFPAVAQAVPAFPGAEGFGAIATGGRGGRVIKVTTLAPSGPGSLQSALDATGARIIVFDVSGIIPGDVTINQGDVTIAGQTAPGAGITIAGRLMGRYSTAVGNIIIRHLRVRPPARPSSIPGNQYDSVQLSRQSRLILDHVSASWGVDEIVDLYESRDATVQWSTIEEASVGGHPDGSTHNYGLINGPDGARVSIHHNLFAHNRNRNPAIANGPAEVRGNVAYNVRHGFVHHNPATGPIDIVGNYYRQGPNDTLFPFYFDGGAGASLSYFMRDNFIDDPGDAEGVVDDPWRIPYQHPTFDLLGKPVSYRAEAEHVFSSEGYVPVTARSSNDAYKAVLDRAGAFPRDVVTRRAFAETVARTGTWGARRPASLLEGLTPGTAAPDTDGDGMADAWETAWGLDPAQAGDHAKVMPSGYTAIEEYVNQAASALVGDSVPSPPAPSKPPTPDPTPAPQPPSQDPPVAPAPSQPSPMPPPATARADAGVAPSPPAGMATTRPAADAGVLTTTKMGPTMSPPVAPEIVMDVAPNRTDGTAAVSGGCAVSASSAGTGGVLPILVIMVILGTAVARRRRSPRR